MEKKLGHALDTYSSDVALYENAKDIDAVIISTADFQHAQHATHAVLAGKDAYCEAARERIKTVCDTPDADVHFLVGGTQTNQVAISTLLSEDEAVITALIRLPTAILFV